MHMWDNHATASHSRNWLLLVMRIIDNFRWRKRGTVCIILSPDVSSLRRDWQILFPWFPMCITCYNWSECSLCFSSPSTAIAKICFISHYAQIHNLYINIINIAVWSCWVDIPLAFPAVNSGHIFEWNAIPFQQLVMVSTSPLSGYATTTRTIWSNIVHTFPKLSFGEAVCSDAIYFEIKIE